MTKLVNYLKAYHADSSYDEIATDFMDKFGVGVKTEGDLFLFKYNQLAAKWVRNITHECRGVIARRTDRDWTYVARPFDKFFNQAEGHNPYFMEKDFNDAIANFWLVEKADGTCIQFWWDESQGRFRVSTLGTITTHNVGDWDMTFDELFWRVLGVQPDDLAEDLFDKQVTYLFELCATENRILTKYPQDKLFLLGWRNTERGLHAHRQEQEEWVAKSGLNITLPYAEKMVHTGLDTLEKVKLFVHDATSMTEEFGEYPEGFVIYDGLKPICKMKNEQYLSLHHISGGDHLHTRNVIIDAYFAGTLDDIMDHLTDPMKEFADSLKEKVESLFLRMQAAFNDMNSLTFETQKEYALFVQQAADREFWPFFFQKKDDILDSTVDNMEVFTNWLTLSYKRFLDFWKAKK